MKELLVTAELLRAIQRQPQPVAPSCQRRLVMCHERCTHFLADRTLRAKDRACVCSRRRL